MTGDDGKITLIGRIKEKLIAAKERTAQTRRLQSAPVDLPGDNSRHRLPPGQRLVEKWPVLDLGVTPKIDTADWRLAIDGLVENPVVWDWDDFTAQPMTDIVSDIHCVTTWSLYDSTWQGLATRDLLAIVQPQPEARFVLFRSYDGYTTNVPLSRLAEADALLARAWNGEPISLQHGGPLRVVIPGLYFWKSAKWVRRISFAADDAPGYWEVRGYHNEADPWKEERYG